MTFGTEVSWTKLVVSNIYDMRHMTLSTLCTKAWPSSQLNICFCIFLVSYCPLLYICIYICLNRLLVTESLTFPM